MLIEFHDKDPDQITEEVLFPAACGGLVHSYVANYVNANRCLFELMMNFGATLVVFWL